MDLQFFVTVNLMSLCAVASLLLLRARPIGYQVWVLSAALVTAIGAAALSFGARQAAWITTAPFLVFLVVPVVLSRLASQAIAAGQRQRARTLAKLVALLHPGGAAVFSIGLEQVQAAKSSAELLSELKQLEAAATPEQRALLDALRAVEHDDWNEVLACTRRPQANAFNMAPLTIRAFGELGRTDDMVHAYERVKTRMLGPNGHFCQLFLFAFAGAEAHVAKLLDSRFAALTPDAKPYWLAIARLRADPTDVTARAALQEIAATTARAKSRTAVLRHLAATVQPASPETLALVAAAGARLDRIDARPRRPFSKLVVTIGLIAVNVAMFGLTEWRGGSESWEVLAETGALLPEAVFVGGEWWRLLTAAFLHFGPVHLAANMLTLALFGQVIESLHGPVRMAALYLACAVASMAATLWALHLGLVDHDLLVGASGAVLGLFGAVVADAIATWLRTRDTLDRSRLLLFGAFVVLQTAIDFSIQNVSFLAHASGFIAGLLIGFALVRWPPPAAAPVKAA